MSHPISLPNAIEVRPAPPEHEPVLANLLELYAYDFSEILGFRLQPNGRFGYPELPLYWQDPTRFPFLIEVDGHLAGFALVRRGSRISGDPSVWDMAEFFVVRGLRKRGIGAAVAQHIWRRFAGVWEVRVLDGNEPARAFWAAAVRGLTRSPAEPVVADLDGKRWHVFQFASPAAEETG